MFRLPLYVLVALVTAFGGGSWATLRLLDATSGFGAISVGAWDAYPDIQTKRADPYARAHRSEEGRLLLGQAEGLLFTALADDAGRDLRGECRYRLSGRTPPARFWTLRATDEDGRPLTAAPEKPDSLQSWRLLQDQNGTFEAVVGQRPAPGNWLSVTHAGPFRLVLTLIDTPTASSAGLGEVAMPAITRMGCDAA
ncbi:DUF1214 domain-containing protein [Pseudohoeflea coraliihabitans]|uniref:DUF1214 domain-containing protein n=1 Tax=Pseudohoeflea coraliihabitans TaxID=2860393 RepID=A0ABS6WRT8_9HYPH|nr:DUF1214 domain-containing protein [Pseudohoeflea sp. DP4N28-3]MBW3098650.1 DUF1214 domain-containing protein [Pseudohoeflea sp. DP4N28-3]